ncbi:MAG TPA: Crp/Fnr family transcriptional regulator [Stellaceae bacterium]|nr:Crp/Fnr family transcriptional regulator [Stellaceae bacterium]
MTSRGYQANPGNQAGSDYQERRRIFSQHHLLGKLSDSEIDALVTYSRVEHYAAGREIFAKDSPGQSLMAVLHGSVRISSISIEGKEIVFNIINSGEIFGEIAMLDGGERSGDATAITECDILVLNRRDFMPFLENHADICLMLIRILCQRLRQTSEQVEDLLFRHLEARVAKALLHLSGQATGPGIRSSALELHLSQSELGHIVGSSRESVNKQLQVWQRAGLIDLAKGSIVIRDPIAIERLI